MDCNKPRLGEEKKGSALWEMMKRKVAFLLLHQAMTKKNATGDCLKSSGGERLAVCDLAFCFMPDNSSSVKDILTSPSVKKKKKKCAGSRRFQHRGELPAACGCPRCSKLLHVTHSTTSKLPLCSPSSLGSRKPINTPNTTVASYAELK